MFFKQINLNIKKKKKKKKKKEWKYNDSFFGREKKKKKVLDPRLKQHPISHRKVEL